MSLELPLDIRAAMEKALAREESCGLAGGGVYSMAKRQRGGSAGGCLGREYRGHREGLCVRAGVPGGAEQGYWEALCARHRPGGSTGGYREALCARPGITGKLSARALSAPPP